MFEARATAGNGRKAVLCALIVLVSASFAEERLAPFLGNPVFEKQRLFNDQRYPNIVFTTKGTVLAVWGNGGLGK